MFEWDYLRLDSSYPLPHKPQEEQTTPLIFNQELHQATENIVL